MEDTKKTKAQQKETTTKRVLNFIKEDHPFENWVLFILALVLLVLSIYILLSAATDKNAFADQYFNIANSGWAIFNKPWKVIVSALVYSVIPVFKPSFKELKHVTWTDKKTLFKNSLIVLGFIAFLTVLFYLFDLGLIPLFRLIFGE